MVSVKYFTTGISKDLECDMTLSTANAIVFNCDLFNFAINLSDIIEIEDFVQLLKGEQKEILINCVLKKDDKVYKGKRKFIFKNNLKVSQGGIRLEFDSVARALLLKVVQALKHR